MNDSCLVDVMTERSALEVEFTFISKEFVGMNLSCICRKCSWLIGQAYDARHCIIYNGWFNITCIFTFLQVICPSSASCMLYYCNMV